MSWDVLLTRLPYSIKSVQELPDDYETPPLGPRSDVEKALRAAAPDIDLDDPEQGELAGSTWSMEVILGDGDSVGAVLLTISGSGGDILPTIFRMAAELKCRVLDCSAGDVITEHDTSTWLPFQDFRGRRY